MRRSGQRGHRDVRPGDPSPAHQAYKPGDGEGYRLLRVGGHPAGGGGCRDRRAAVHGAELRGVPLQRKVQRSRRLVVPYLLRLAHQVRDVQPEVIRGFERCAIVWCDDGPVVQELALEHAPVLEDVSAGSVFFIRVPVPVVPAPVGVRELPVPLSHPRRELPGVRVLGVEPVRIFGIADAFPRVRAGPVGFPVYPVAFVLFARIGP